MNCVQHRALMSLNAWFSGDSDNELHALFASLSLFLSKFVKNSVSHVHIWRAYVLRKVERKLSQSQFSILLPAKCYVIFTIKLCRLYYHPLICNNSNYILQTQQHFFKSQKYDICYFWNTKKLLFFQGECKEKI